MDRSLYQMGYSFDGLKLFPRAHVRLEGTGLLEATAYDHLKFPRPADVDYLEWLMQTFDLKEDLQRPPK